MLTGKAAEDILIIIEMPPLSATERVLKKEKKMKQIILTGDRPTGRLHVGHYVADMVWRAIPPVAVIAYP